MSRFDLVKCRVELVFITMFLLIAAILNLQFLSGANLNSAIAGHDEYLTIKDVYSIIRPLSFKHFFLAVMHGSFLAYGSLMFYLDALIAFIPYKLFGLEGMVYTIRMTHAFFLVSGLSLLSHTFLRTGLSKILFMLSSLAVAHSFYFAMMPKPEPIQLFFFALFLYYFKKNEWNYGRHFLWLGMAFGLKITLLIFLPFIFIAPLFSQVKIEWKTKLKEGIGAFLFFLLGFIVAVPYLLLAFVRPTYIDSFLDANLRNTSKDYDDSSISLFDWLGEGLAGPYFGQESLGLIFLLLIIFVFCWRAFMMVKEKAFKGEILLSFLGLIFIVFIALKVDRLWPHYMWMGYVLSVLALNELHGATKNAFIKKGLATISTGIVLLIASEFVSVNYEKYFLVDQQPEIVTRMHDSEQLFRYIEESLDQGLDVATDGTIHYPYSQFVTADPYHPFAEDLPQDDHTDYRWFYDNYEEIWDEPNDLVVFGDRHPLKDNESLRKRFPHWDVDKHMASCMQHLATDFVLDTIIGELEVYRRLR